MTKLSLTAEDYNNLVAGKVVKRDGVEIALQDIGFAKMRYGIDAAEQFASTETTRFQTIGIDHGAPDGERGGRMVACPCGQVTGIDRLHALNMINGQTVTCPACGKTGSI